MSGIIIWDPIDRFLWGIAITVIFIAGILYFRMGKYKKDPKEKTLIFGFAFLFFCIVIYRILAISYETLTPGTYQNYAFYGDYDKINPIFDEVLLRLVYISSLVGFLLLFLSFERYLKRTKYSITILYVFFLIIVSILPINYVIIVENYIISFVSTILILCFLFYFTKHSRIEFKSISSLLVLGFLLNSIGFALTDNDFQQYNAIPLFIAPVCVIIGGLICIAPTIINPKYYTQSLIYWKVVGIMIIGGFCFSLILFIYLKIILYIIIGMIIIFVIFSYLFYNQIKILKLEFFFNQEEEDYGDLPNILGTFAKPQQIFSLIAENANDLIEIFDENFHIEYINEHIHNNLLGYSKEDILGQNRIEFIHQDDISVMLKKQKDFIINKEIIGEVRFKKKDGNYLWLEYRGKAFKSNNYGTKYLLISRDITRQKEYITKLKEIDEMRKEFVIRATHDLKNPITSIYAISKMIYDIFEQMPEHHKNILPEKLLTLYKYLYNDSGRLKKLAHNLLDISRLESGTFELNKENVNVKEIIDDCITGEEFLSQKRNIQISNNLPPNLIINADEIRLSQIFQNLISNALKNTPIDGKVCIEIEKNENYVKLFVKDTGIGLTSDEIERLFTKFCNIERKENSIITEGFGCGLYITKQIVLSHGGKIWVESFGRSKGSTFIVELPIN